MTTNVPCLHEHSQAHHRHTIPVALVSDLIDPIVTLAVRLLSGHPFHSPILTPSSPVTNHIRSLLNVLSAHTNLLPNAPLAALLAFPWIDLTLAGRSGNLWLCNSLLSLKRVRPLQYSTKAALKVASAHGYVHFLDWWANVAGLPLDVGGGGLESAMTAASEAGHVNVLDWWLSIPDKSALELVNVYTHGLLVATQSGHAHVLHWWQHAGLPMVVDGWFIKPALRGQVQVFQWWTAFDTKGETLAKTSHISAIVAAAMYGGHFSIVEHMLTYDVKGDEGHWRNAVGMRTFATVGPQWAYVSGNLGFVQRIDAMYDTLVSASMPSGCRDKRKLCQPDYSLAVFLACAFGHTHLLDHLIQQRRIRDLVRSTATTAMSRNAWSLLQQLHRIPSPPNPAYPPDLDSSASPLLPLDVALVNNRTSVLDWWLANKFPMNAVTQPLSAIALAPSTCQTSLIKWWIKHSPHTPTVADFTSALQLATRLGSLPFLMRLKAAYPGFASNTPEVAKRAILAAATHGHLPTLQHWVLSLPLPAFPHRLVDSASALGHLHVLEWLREVGHLRKMHWTEAAVDGASRGGHIAVLDWWRDQSNVGMDCIRYSAQAWGNMEENPDPVGVVAWWLNQVTRGDGREWPLDPFRMVVSKGSQLLGDGPWMHIIPVLEPIANLWVRNACACGMTLVLDMCVRGLGQQDDEQIAIELVKIAVKSREMAAVEWAVRRFIQRFGMTTWDEEMKREGRVLRDQLKESSKQVREWWERTIGREMTGYLDEE